MGWDNNVAIAGNLVRDPETKFTATGTAIAKFTVAVNDKKLAEERTYFFDVTCFGRMAENVDQSGRKGDRVSVQGKLEQQTWETDQGEKRSKIGIVADDVALSMKWTGAGPVGVDSRSQPPSTQTQEPPQSQGMDSAPF